METTKKLICSEKDAGIRLDSYLFEQFPDYSRSYFQKLVDQGCVIVDQKIVKKSGYRLSPGQVLMVTFPPVQQCAADAIAMDIEVIDEQQDFMVINKPAGLLVHAASSHSSEPTLVNGLMHYFKELDSFGQLRALENSAHIVRPGIVHRLDKDTSGLLLVARTLKGHLVLSELFKKRLITKEYQAIVQGHPPQTERITHPIGRHPTEWVKMAPYGFNSRTAISNVTVLEYYKETALIAIAIETGRTHQIRVHCSAQRYPIVGDAVYGSSSQLIARQALHAYKIAFFYENQTFSYECALPEDMRKLVAYYKKIA